MDLSSSDITSTKNDNIWQTGHTFTPIGIVKVASLPILYILAKSAALAASPLERKKREHTVWKIRAVLKKRGRWEYVRKSKMLRKLLLKIIRACRVFTFRFVHTNRIKNPHMNHTNQKAFTPTVVGCCFAVFNFCKKFIFSILNDFELKDSSRLGTLFVRRATLIGLASLASYFPFQESKADLIWSVAPTATIFEWDVDNQFGYGGIDTLQIAYTVKNDSSIGDQNNLIQYSINAGANHGIYNAIGPDGWLATINPDSTIFSGNGNFIRPDSQVAFFVYSEVLNTNPNGIASAISRGFTSDPNVPFPNQQTTVPNVIPEPSTLLLVGLAGLAAFGKKIKEKIIERCYFNS